jgi:hypothetical protein
MAALNLKREISYTDVCTDVCEGIGCVIGFGALSFGAGALWGLAAGVSVVATGTVLAVSGAAMCALLILGIELRLQETVSKLNSSIFLLTSLSAVQITATVTGIFLAIFGPISIGIMAAIGLVIIIYGSALVHENSASGLP